MDNKIKKFRDYLPILLVILSIATFIELAYGSKYLGLVFLVASVIVLFFSVKKFKEISTLQKKKSLPHISLGIIIILSVFLYNLLYEYPKLNLQTLDIMVIVFGISLIISYSGTKYFDVGLFLFYFSLIFIILFLSLFIVPNKLKFIFPYIYGKYAIVLPTVYLAKKFGMNVELFTNRIIEVHGVQHALLKVDLACFGWYSLLLIISMILSYNMTIKKFPLKHVLKIIGILWISSYLANFLRILVLVAVTYRYGVEKMQIIHAHLGWILFISILMPISYMFLRSKTTRD